MNDSPSRQLPARSLSHRFAPGSEGQRLPGVIGHVQKYFTNDRTAFEFKHHGDHLYFRLGNHFSGSDLIAVSDRLREQESAADLSPHRILDFLPTETMALNFVNVIAFARVRRAARLRNNVRCALVANTPAKYGIMRMLQAVDANPMTEIGIFLDSDSAVKWVRGGPGCFCPGFPDGPQPKD